MEHAAAVVPEPLVLSEVTNIVTQPDSTSQQFVALCRKIADKSGSGSHHHSALIALDLSGLHERPCKGVDTAGNGLARCSIALV